MPVLYWFAWIGQHGRPVLPPWTVGVAAHTTHPDNLVVTNTVTHHVMDARTRESERGKERGRGEGEGEGGCNKAARERQTGLV